MLERQHWCHQQKEQSLKYQTLSRILKEEIFQGFEWWQCIVVVVVAAVLIEVHEVIVVDVVITR